MELWVVSLGWEQNLLSTEVFLFAEKVVFDGIMSCLSEVRAGFTEYRNVVVQAENQTIALVEDGMFRTYEESWKRDRSSVINVPTPGQYCGMQKEFRTKFRTKIKKKVYIR